LQESDVLSSEVKLLEAERHELARELGLKMTLEEAWAKRGARQGMALKEAQARVTGLEASLQQVGK
jgi:hypothetical protein